MKRTLFATFLTWVLTMQAGLAFTPKTNKQFTEQKKFTEQAIATYNSFAANPVSEKFPSTFTPENVQAFRSYMKKNKIMGPLPEAKLTKSGAIELTLKGQTLTLELNPILGIVRINGRALILKSGINSEERLEEITKFLTSNKSAGTFLKTMESLFSMLVPSANADCLEKYNEAIKAQETEVNKASTPYAVGGYAMGIGFLLILLFPPAAAKYIAAAAGTAFAGAMVVTWKNSDRDYKNEKLLEELVSIRGALAVAKAGKIPATTSEGTENQYTEDELRFLNLYLDYSQMTKAAGGVPISQEAVLALLAEGDKSEKFCTPTVTDSISKISEKIMQSTLVNPNEVNKATEPVKPESSSSVVDQKLSDSPKNSSEELAAPGKDDTGSQATSK